ncbi:hypothetical protein GOBAR_AA13217 [Gossypium barbadense]|uniref:Uncharacterized protein n=1 Tax=Gossypium barbadense TaxID=3634 RepID=A0A2P5XVR9_GOSBA|nr:hypothetical protein GOBAR_AA13217 [Gossypium barbadense]
MENNQRESGGGYSSGGRVNIVSARGASRELLVYSLSSTLPSAWSRWCKEFTLPIPAINFVNIRLKKSIVYLKSVKFGMNYLDCSIWENTEYRERNFFIRFRSGNARIYYI